MAFGGTGTLVSTTTSLVPDSHAPNDRMATMANLGLHFMKPEWQNQNEQGRHFSTTFCTTTLKIKGTDEQMVIPLQVCTTVRDVRELVARAAAVHVDQVKFVVKRGCTYHVQKDCEECGKQVVVSGIKSFAPAKKVWPNPIAVIGLGYCGLKTMMHWSMQGYNNLIAFDRNDKFGGYCWLTAANKTSKLQTEFAAFHVWYGPSMGCGQVKDCDIDLKGWMLWPRKAKVLEHFEFAADQFGVRPYCRFKSNVDRMDIIGKPTDPDKSYVIGVENLEKKERYEVKVDGLIQFPGCMQVNRIIEYKGEDDFDGHIGYGMNDQAPYEHIPGAVCAIVGNGAFAVENVRTCVDLVCEKVYLITRRKNLPCPRLPCWFVHQAKIPISGKQLLDIMSPAFAQAGLGDPWEYHAVMANTARTNATIVQQSRFGIGDVTFLAHRYGKLEYCEDHIKRLSVHTIHLEKTGKKIENCTVLIKALGLLGSYEVDRLNKTKEMVGNWPDGDFRRPIGCDPLGLNASQFTTMSLGIGIYGKVHMTKYLFDFPYEYYRMVQEPGYAMLPTIKAGQNDRPAYISDVKHEMSIGMTLGGLCPRMVEADSQTGDYKHKSIHSSSPLKQYLKICMDEWDEYQERWKKEGWTKDIPYMPYPYKAEDVEVWQRDHDAYVEEKAKQAEAKFAMQAGVEKGSRVDTSSLMVSAAESSNHEYWKAMHPGVPLHRAGGGGKRH
eukprot:gnl/TRDRNA2_/TRDRNA2_85610_c0_seq1.p1 gnl/TRDRNA2_/TRDRNA2_85610_c0~~gnl/TRDRNA2_/TRDRNA2_85610_c0_seq1.p1  ORF type:complete len:718 (-),score=136.25 gnl/TRDRNA2_/TRDRNA2_85610_c0_seq1:44-2197(-)